MKRTGKIRWGNLRIGILISAALAMLLYSSFRGGGTSIFEAKDFLIAYFTSVNGLVRGAPVWLGGVEVGNIKSVTFVNLDERRRIKVEFKVKESVWMFLTSDTKVKLGTIGLLGDKYLEIVPGTKGLPLVSSGDEIGILDEAGLEALTKNVPEMAGSVDSILTNVREVTSRLARGDGSAGKLMTDSALYDNLVLALNQTTAVLAEIRKSQADIMKRLNSTLANTSAITAKIDSGTGSLGQLVNDKAVYDNLSHSTARLDSILSKIDRGDGSAGALINDARLYEDIRDLVVRINSLVADIEKNPRKYFKFSVF